jgi:hypothetical protein
MPRKRHLIIITASFIPAGNIKPVSSIDVQENRKAFDIYLFVRECKVKVNLKSSIKYKDKSIETKSQFYSFIMVFRIFHSSCINILRISILIYTYILLKNSSFWMQPFHDFCLYISKSSPDFMKERLLNFAVVVILWLIIVFLA